MPRRRRCADVLLCRIRKRDKGEGLAATAENCGICCRCGKGTEEGCHSEGLWQGCRGKCRSATAGNRGICCRCGRGTKKGCRSGGLWQGCRGKCSSATAGNRGFCCRCGRNGGKMLAEGRDRRGAGYRRMTETSRGPWAPMTRACSMSAVLEGPAMKLPKS